MQFFEDLIAMEGTNANEPCRIGSIRPRRQARERRSLQPSKSQVPSGKTMASMLQMCLPLVRKRDTYKGGSGFYFHKLSNYMGKPSLSSFRTLASEHACACMLAQWLAHSASALLYISCGTPCLNRNGARPLSEAPIRRSLCTHALTTSLSDFIFLGM